jgi:hypothetical protein
MDKYLSILFIAYSLLLSGISFYWQLASGHRSRACWTIQTLVAASIMVFAFLATPWAFTSYYLRYIVARSKYTSHSLGLSFNGSTQGFQRPPKP